MTTIKKVNEEIVKIGIQAELIKGDGYFYFIGDDVELAFTTSVMVNSLNQLSLEEWVEEAINFKNESKGKKT